MTGNSGTRIVLDYEYIAPERQTHGMTSQLVATISIKKEDKDLKIVSHYQYTNPIVTVT